LEVIMAARSFVCLGLQLGFFSLVGGCTAAAGELDSLHGGGGSAGASTSEAASEGAPPATTTDSEDGPGATLSHSAGMFADEKGAPREHNRAPRLVFPQDGQELDVTGSYIFKVAVPRRSEGTLCSLWQGDTRIWENYADDGVLGADGECAVHPDHELHRRFQPGQVRFMARSLQAGQWSEAAEITIVLTVPSPVMEYPSAGQVLGLGGSYMFKVRAPAEDQGTLCSLWQRGKRVWENLADDGHLGQRGECALHPGHPKHQALESGDAVFMSRSLVRGHWSRATQLSIKLE
jgi:hypothetical protein